MDIRVRTIKERMSAQVTLWLIGGLVVFVIFSYWSSSWALWRYWVDEPYLGGHGRLVAGLSCWLILRVRAQIAAAPVQPLPVGLMAVLVCSVVLLVCWRAGIQALQLWMLPSLILAASLAAFGTTVTRLIFVPVAYLYFAMPAWNVLTVTLQNLTLNVVGLIAPLVGVPAVVSGTLVTFSDGTVFEVTPACSGVGFLVQGLAVGALIGELDSASISRRIRLLAIIGLVSLATNWVRVLLLLELGYSSGMRNVLASSEHLQFGYVLFVVVLVLFAWIATGRRKAPSETALPVRYEAPRLGWYLAALGTLAIAPLLVAFGPAPRDSSAAASELHPMAGRSSWHGPMAPTGAAWQPIFVGSHAESHVAYEGPSGRRVEAVAIGYPEQEQDRELVNESNSLVGKSGLRALDADLIDRDGGRFRELLVTDAAGAQSVIWWFYDIDGKAFITPLFAQLWYGLRALRSPVYSALYALKAECNPSCGQGRDTLTEFVHQMGPRSFVIRDQRMLLNWFDKESGGLRAPNEHCGNSPCADPGGSMSGAQQ